MFCTNCGAQIDDKALFCPTCGTKVAANAAKPEVTDTVQAVDPVPEAPVPMATPMSAVTVSTPEPAKASKAVRKLPLILIVVVTLATMFVGLFSDDLDFGWTIALLVGCVPSFVLLLLIYKLDNIEPEPVKLLVKLFIGGGSVSLIIAIVLEYIAEFVLGSIFDRTTVVFMIIDNMLGVALVEEFSKYIVAKKLTWKNPAFNYRFDGVVYCVTAAIGFEIFENIMYIVTSATGAFSTALLRASFPGHAIFGIYMGYYFGQAKSVALRGDTKKAASLRMKGIIIATLIHGFYDFMCDFCGLFELGNLIFIVTVVPLVAILNVFAYKNIKKYQSEDAAV